MKYAAETKVSAEASRAEIERILARFGATHFGYALEPEGATIVFQVNNRRIRFAMQFPDRNDKQFWYTGTRHERRTPENALKSWELATRQKWRALALAIKSKLAAVEAKIATFDDEFLAYVVLPDGKTVGESLQPQIEDACSTGRMPTLLTERAGQ